MFTKIALIGVLASQVSALQVSTKDGNPEKPETSAQTIMDVVAVHDMVTRIYQDAMQQTIAKIYKAHDADESGQLSKDEALDFFYHILGVVRQDRELMIAQAAAKIADMDSDAEVTKEEMEHFVVNLFTNQYDTKSYETQGAKAPEDA